VPRISIERATLLYALAYLPYIVLTRMMATTPASWLDRPLTGLEILPAMLTLAAVFTYLFMGLAGWTRDVTRVRVAGLALPFADRWTALSGLCTAVILFSVPLSYTFVNVSVPFIQLLMRGDLLLIAPLVDVIAGRRVRWWSWTALALVAAAMAIGFQARGLFLPPLAIFTVVIYTAAYFCRLWVMSKVAKNDDPATLRRFFSEEKIVAFPLALLMLALITAAGGSDQAGELRRGFVEIWGKREIVYIAFCGAMVCLTGVFSAIILLDARENSFCVPLERSASILAGIVGSVILGLAWGVKLPSAGEFAGAALLIVAIGVLSFGPCLRSGRSAVPSLVVGEPDPE
jgi:hypothetical protein